jgi:conjugal transfer pilus assembly protein TrbC
MLPALMFLILLLCSAANASQTTIDEALQKAKTLAESYKGSVQKCHDNAKEVIASKSSSRCPLYQSCLGKKREEFSQNILPNHAAGNISNASNTDAPLIFVSKSMPKAALKSLSIEAKKIGARLIIRGMVNNSMRETGELTKELRYPVDIDPKLFKKFDVRQVPTFVVPVANEGMTQWYKLQGNVTLSFVLEKAGKTPPIKTVIREAKLEMETVVKESRQ